MGSESITPTQLEPDIPLPIAAYALPGEGKIERCLQQDGSVKWAIRRPGDCMNDEGQWEWEPLPSSRDFAFMARCRFPSAAAAYAVWKRFAQKDGS